MADEKLNPIEAHEKSLRDEFVAASQEATASEDEEFLNKLRAQFDEANARELRITELATSNYELDAAKVETDRLNNLGATRFTSAGSGEPIADNPQTKGGGLGATSAATATPSVVARSSNAPAAPTKATNPVKTEPNSGETPESE